jgi:predicted dehydrogenase
MEFLQNLRLVSAVAKTLPGDLPSPSGELRVLFEGEIGLGSCLISVSAKPYLKFLDIYGTEMSIRVNLNNNTLVKFRRDGIAKVSKALVNIDQSLQLMSRTITNTLGTLLGLRTLGHGALIKKFYESVRKGIDPPVTGEDGRAAVVVLDQVWAELGHDPRQGGLNNHPNPGIGLDVTE